MYADCVRNLTAVLVLTFFVSGIGVAASTVDCSYLSQTDAERCTTSTSRTYYCRPPYSCCGNNRGCCFDGDYNDQYSTAEIVGLTLCTSALFVMGMMALVICGATFCSDKDDNSVLFSGGK